MEGRVVKKGEKKNMAKSIHNAKDAEKGFLKEICSLPFFQTHMQPNSCSSNPTTNIQAKTITTIKSDLCVLLTTQKRNRYQPCMHK